MKIAINTDMIYCRLKNLIAEKEFKERRKITYKVIQDETGLSSTTIAKLLAYKGVQRIDGSTLDKLCEFFGCQVGDILTYVPDTLVDAFDPHKRQDELNDLTENYEIRPESKEEFIIKQKKRNFT